MQFGHELEQLFLLVVGEFQCAPPENEVLQGIARVLGGGSFPSVMRMPNCVIVPGTYKGFFPVIDRVCGGVGLRCLQRSNELRIFPM